ncbi:MAG: hypothetical protein ACKO91_06260 [Acidimicrobiales bacterium]
MPSNTTSHTHADTGELAGTRRPSAIRRPHAEGSPTHKYTAAAWIAGGALWVSAGLLYAQAGWRFRASAITWLAADLLVVAGLLGLLRLRPHESSRAATTALVTALTARMLFATAEVSGLVAGTENETLLPIAALLTAVSSIAYGTLARHADRQLSAASVSMGVYFFAVMMPFLAITGETNSLAIAGWGIPTALMGLAVRHRRRRGHDRNSPTAN